MKPTPEQQGLIDEAAKEYATHGVSIGPGTQYLGEAERTDQRGFEGFTAGAEWALGNREVMEGVMGPFAEWIVLAFIDDGEENRPWRKFGTDKFYTAAELIALYFEHINKKENG